MGLAGAGLASLLAACLMVAFMLAAMAKQKYFRRYALLRFSGVRFDRLREIVSVGLPISVSNLGEMGVFMISTVIMGRFGAEAVAAHVVVLRLAGVLYSVPLGYAQAATVRIGFAIGAGQMNRATLAIRAAVFLALAQGFLFMAAILLFRHEIASLFAGSGEMAAGIVAQSGMFLLMLALAQPLECLGVVGNGILRGFKITRQPMYFSVFAFWGVGFVGGMTLAFNFGLAGVGIWAGLGAGSSLFGLLIGSRLLRQWKQREFSAVAA
jgi:MATE family multidrug resistance protein